MTPIKRRLLYIFRGTLLRLRISWDHGKILTVSVGYHVDREDKKGKPKWDGSRCLRNTTHGEDKVPASVINKILDQLEEKIDTVFHTFEIKDSVPNPKELKEQLTPSAKDKHTLGELVKEYRKEQATLNQWSERTKRSVKQSLDNMLDVFGEDKKIEVITDDDIVRLMDYMLSKKCFEQKYEGDKPVVKNGLSNSTINRYMIFISAFAKWAKDKGYCEDTRLLRKVKNLSTTETPVIFLTMEELQRFRAVDLSPAKQEISDVFYFGCFTGLRYSDLADLRWSQVKDDHIEIVTKKTHDLLTIQLNKFSREVLSHRKRGGDDDKVFYVINNADFNKGVKHIAKAAGINTPIKIVSFSGSERIAKTLPKWHYITSHTPRKTFVTNALSLGIPVPIVMKWTGHKTYKAMKPYIDIVSSAQQKSMDLFNSIDRDEDQKSTQQFPF